MQNKLYTVQQMLSFEKHGFILVFCSSKKLSIFNGISWNWSHYAQCIFCIVEPLPAFIVNQWMFHQNSIQSNPSPSWTLSYPLLSSRPFKSSSLLSQCPSQHFDQKLCFLSKKHFNLISILVLRSCVTIQCHFYANLHFSKIKHD